MNVTADDRKIILDSLALLADCQLKMIHWKAELAAQVVRLHSLEGEIERAHRALAGVIKRECISGADPG